MREASAALLLVLALVAQTPAPQFKSGVDVVRFDVTVLDKERRPIAGLTQNDFRVTEDGKPLRIAGFEAVTIAPAASEAASSPAKAALRVETVTNHVDGPGRLVVILMDASIPNGQPIVTARMIANAAIDAMSPNDFGAVLFDSGIAGYRQQDFTKNRDRLKAAIASAQMGATAAFSGGACLCGMCSLEKLTTVVEALGAAQDYRKMIVFVGHRLPITSSAGSARCDAGFRSLYDRLLHAIERSNVTIHVFDPNGLETGAAGADAAGRAPRETASSRVIREGDLAALPEYSGGRAVFDTNQPEQVVPAVFEESRTYYVLAVERGPARKGGSAHSVKIAVTRPDAIVASRSTYFDASRDRVTASVDPLERALSELLPRADVPLRMALKPGSMQGSSLDITLATPLAASTRADVLVGVFDEFSKSVGSERAKVDLPARGGGDVEWQMHLNPKPGHYEVRAAVQIGSSIGTIAGYIDVAAPARNDTKANASTTSAHRVRIEPSPETAALLVRAGAYLAQYSDLANGLLLEEKYTQQVNARPPRIRELRSDLLILPDAAEGWLQFRDVMAVDGKPVADRTDRLLRLFASPTTDARSQARRIADEGARYNISGAVTVSRSLNLPMAALLFLRDAAQTRSDFRPQGSAGSGGQRVSFTEVGTPTLIGVTGGEPATGDFWIDPSSGHVQRSELHVVSRSKAATASATIRVQYAFAPKTQLMLPTLMQERYMVQDPRGAVVETIEGTATYSNPRQFKVTTEAK